MMGWKRRWDMFDALGALATIALLSFLGIAALECVTKIRSGPAVIACRARGLDGLHPPFSAEVTCAPRVGQALDTLYVKTEAR